jgi:tetratricopeptide (TPR) repeat protein
MERDVQYIPATVECACMSMKINCNRLVGILCIAAGLTSCSKPQTREARFLQRGKALLEQKDYSRAILEFRNASQVMPKDAEPVYQAGLVYLAMQNYQVAVGDFRKALQLNPKHAGAQLALSSLMLTSRSPDILKDAEKRLQELAAGPQSSAEALDTLAMAELRLGKPEDATRLLDQAMEKFPGDLGSAVELARLKLSQHDPAGAEAAVKKAVANAPKSPEAALALGRLYLQMGKPDQAEPELRRALALNPAYAPALLSLALLQMNRNRPDQAEQTFKQLGTLTDKKYRDYRSIYGLFLFQHGKKDAALAQFQKLAIEDPSDRVARTRVVTALVFMNRVPEADKVLTEALKGNPKDTEALLQQSDLRLQRGDVSGAENNLNQVLSLTPDSAVAHFGLAKVRHARGLPLVERQELNLALSRDPKFLAAREALCRNFLEANEFKAALELMDQAPPAQKDSLAVLAARNWALLGLGKNDEARAGIEKGLRASRTPDLLMQDGLLKVRGQDFTGARTDAEELLKQDPENERALGLLVDTYARQKQLPKAVARVREMVSARPKSPRLQLMLGRVLAVSGDRVEAKKAFEAAAALDPKSTAAKLALAQIDFSGNQLDAARKQVNAVLAVEPRNAPVLTMAGDIELKAGDRNAAIAKYRLAIDADASNAAALNNLAYLVALDNPDEALKFAQQAMELAPDNAAVQDTLGWVYYRKAIYQTAIRHLKTAVTKESTPRRQFHLGMAYLKAGDRELGQRTIVAALKQDPNLAKTEQGW